MFVASCTAFSPRAHFGPPARALGIPVQRDRCARGNAELVDVSQPVTSVALRDDVRRDFACIAMRDSIVRDEMRQCTPPVDVVFGAPLPARRRVVGDLAYVGLDPREYTYDLVPEPDGAIGVEVRIAFRGALTSYARVREAMTKKLADAAALWSAHAPGARMRFRFTWVHREDNPHYEIDLAEGEPRTPFDLTWGEGWSAHLIAHEIGHMMGLDDEYEQIRKTVGHAIGKEAAWRADPALRLSWLKCDLQSLMCDSKGESAVPQPHHYYVIARRRYCSRKSAGFEAWSRD